MDIKFDFIIVGGGPAGCALAARLCAAASKPMVALFEAGGDNEGDDLRVDGQRWSTFMNDDMNWGYKTTPQKQCLDRELAYFRGRGLGGSSAINFGVWAIGARDDYEEWARVTGDEQFGWEGMQRRFRSLENFDRRIPSTASSKYAAPAAEAHGDSGPLRVGYAAEWERDLPPMLDIIEETGFPLNPDHNSGNPIGMSVSINTAQGGLRSTAKDLITPRPSNLKVLTGSRVRKVVFKDNRAVGVDANGQTYYASQEVILCAGSLDTPRILMHSGIGDPKELNEYKITVIHSLPSVGKGLRDHPHCPMMYSRAKGSTDRAEFYGNKQAMEDARKQWDLDHTGQWSKFGCELTIGWFKLNGLASMPEFSGLPEATQELLLKETIPHYELITHFPMHMMIPDYPESQLDYSSLVVFLSQAQSRGRVALQSSDPEVPLRFNPEILEHALDRRIAIESLREALRIVKAESYAKNTIAQLSGPKSESDEDLLEYWREKASSTWHMTGTVKMGREGEADAAVDKEFRIMGGPAGLRVADMSVVPFMPSGHTQAVAYVTGMTCGEKLVDEYKLEQP